MTGEVVVVLHNRTDRSKRQLTVKIDEQNDTVGAIVERLSKQAQVSRKDLNILMCGRALEEHMTIKELSLGPRTALTALVIEHNVSSTSADCNASNDSCTSPSSSSVPPVKKNSPDIGSYYVWCKPCSDIKRGKLRVYCNRCNSAAVLVSREPTCFRDVLKSKHIPVTCEDCSSDDISYAVFNFKCVDCNEVCAPLSHIRGNWEGSECFICCEPSSYVFDLKCRHPVCRECFQQYIKTSLENSLLINKPPYGFTLGCPVMGCQRCVRDVHHFRILGDEQYKQYQRLATEKLVALDDQGVFCPYSDCQAVFFWEPFNDDGKTSCPECFRMFCRLCNNTECTCNSENETQTTIEATTKKCPNCSVPTERNGGCAHMHCTSCGHHWCFLCVKTWEEECQWNHWFGSSSAPEAAS